MNPGFKQYVKGRNETFKYSFSEARTLGDPRRQTLAAKAVRSRFAGFERNKITARNDMNFVLYSQSLIKVPQKQVLQTEDDEIILNHAGSKVHFHPMNTETEQQACRAAECFIKSCNGLLDFWKKVRSVGFRSVVGCLQLFSDSSQVSMNAGALQIYSLYATLLNFTESDRRRRIMTGDKIVVYFSVSFTVAGEKSVSTDHIKVTSQTKTQSRRLKALHESIAFSLRSLLEIALSGIVCRTKGCTRFILYLLLTSYTANIPECKALLKLKRGVSTASPCHLCLFKSSKLC